MIHLCDHCRKDKYLNQKHKYFLDDMGLCDKLGDFCEKYNVGLVIIAVALLGLIIIFLWVGLEQ
jgi:hypothetical protein